MSELEGMKIAVLMTGWFLHPCNPLLEATDGPIYVFPPPQFILPLFISIHIDSVSDNFLYSEICLSYYRKYQPIGCRDLSTYQSLTQLGIRAYLSGCITSLLKKDFKFQLRGQRSYLVTSTDDDTIDPNFEKIDYFPPQLANRTILERLKLAQQILYQLMEARKVRTDLLHCYLPCRAYGTPVEMINLPTKLMTDNRYLGLVGSTQSPQKLYDQGQVMLKLINGFTSQLLPKDQPLSLTVFLTTIGRESLREMLSSLVGQLRCSDYLYIAIDGEEHFLTSDQIIGEFRDQWQCQVIILKHQVNLGFKGHGLRNYYQHQLSGDYLLHADDDDIYDKEAFRKIRNHVQSKGQLYIFQMTTRTQSVIPVEDRIVLNEIGTPCGVVANLPHLFGRWEDQRGGDYEFWNNTAGLFGESCVHFVREIIYHVIG